MVDIDILSHGLATQATFTNYAGHLELGQSWALALYLQVRSPLSAHFISMDRYRSSAHLANFQVRSSLNRSKKNQWFALRKER